MSCPSNVLFVEKLQDAENPGLYVGGFLESSVLTHKKEQQIKIEGEFKPTVDAHHNHKEEVFGEWIFGCQGSLPFSPHKAKQVEGI